MSNDFNYKGYSGSCLVSIEDDCLHGRILFIDDLITYEGNSVSELGISFKEAVDGYINYCKETGTPANKPYSGSFNIRPGPELHKSAAQCAVLTGVKLNEFVRGAILNAVNLTLAQREFKSNKNEIAISTPEKTWHGHLNFTIKPYKQSHDVASAGSASLIENTSIKAPKIWAGTTMKGIQHETTH
jgi:predicted HicB family RNase H-like nuclease